MNEIPHRQMAPENFEENRRYNSLDKLKAFCAFLIVCIHAYFPGAFGEYYTVLTRIAVPIFFMITGFFFTTSSAKQQIRKLFGLMLTANGIYLLWKIALAALKEEIPEYLKSVFTMKNIVKFLFLNETHLQSHLWYLGAILYVITIVTFIFGRNEKLGKKILYIAVPILLLGDLMLGKYSLLLFHREFPVVLVRNWLFVGLPYFTIGLWIREHQEKIVVRIRKMKLLSIISFTVITSLVERLILVSFNLNPARDHYLSTTFLAVAVFLFFLLYVNGDENRISGIGRDDSTWIYILHPILITILGIVMSRGGIKEAYNYIRPIVVFLTTAVIVDATMKLESKFLRRNQIMVAKENHRHKSTRYKNMDKNNSEKSLPVLYEASENCCGCSACYAICPVCAISMTPDEEGFLYPVVDAQKCIRCYRCILVCAFKKDQEKKGYYKLKKDGDS